MTRAHYAGEHQTAEAQLRAVAEHRAVIRYNNVVLNSSFPK